MRHFLSYDANGELQGEMSFTNAKTGLRGWPDDYELDNPDSTHANTRAWVDSRKVKPAGYVRYDCPCSPTAHTCACAGQFRLGNYVVDGVAVAKPAHAITIDGATYEPGTIIDRAPGADITVAVSAPDAPDDEKLMVLQPATFQMLTTTEQSMELTYASGAVPDIILKAPAQGFIGIVALYGKCCGRVDIKIRGWS